MRRVVLLKIFSHPGAIFFYKEGHLIVVGLNMKLPFTPCPPIPRKKQYSHYPDNDVNHSLGGILIRPPMIPMSVFEEEVAFFQLGDEVLSNLREEEGEIVCKSKKTQVNC